MPILNYTTKVDAFKTVTEIQQVLTRHGATKIIIDTTPSIGPTAITFHIPWNGHLMAYLLPCNFEGVLKALKKQKVAKSFLTQEQALRIGWRIIKDWIGAQLAIVEAEVAALPEVFLPYAVTKEGETLYQRISRNPGTLLLDQ